MTQLKRILFFLVIHLSGVLFSQENQSNKFLKLELNKVVLENKDEINFKKANAFFEKKNWDSTLVYAMKQLEYKNPKILHDYCHFLRGNSFMKLMLFNEAKQEFNLISKKFRLYPYVNYNLGMACIELKNYDKAILYFEELKTIPLAQQQLYSANRLNENLGICYLHLKDFSKAEFYFQKNIDITKNSKDTLSLIATYSNIATLYYDQYLDAQAIPYFEKAYYLSKKINDFGAKRVASKNMAVVEENKSKFKQALVYRKEYDQWKDSLNDQNKIWALADFEKKFAVAQKQKQIKVLEVENQLKQTQRNWLLFSAIVLFVLLTVGLYLYALKVKNAKIILSQKEKLDELNETKDQLFSIVSHDLRSSVNALKTSNAKLSATLETKNYDELNQLIIQNSGIANGAYSLLDNLLHWALLQTKQLYFHKESVHLFSIVQQIEYNYKSLLIDKSITFENSVSKNIFIFVDLDSLKIVLRNLLDNAIKFSTENGKISFYTQDNNPESCQLVLEDTGLGMDEETIAALLKDDELLAKKGKSEAIGTGLGMQLCKQMIKKNEGIIQIESELHKGTKMILRFPKTEQNG